MASPQAFGPKQVIAASASLAQSVYAADLRGDRQPDALSADNSDEEVSL